MNNSNLYTSSVKSQIDPNYQVQYEKNLTGSQRPTYGFQFISDFNPERYGDLKEEFEFADLNKNGTLSKVELSQYLENKMKNILNDEYRPNFIDEIFGKMDENYDEIVTLEEFSHFYYRLEDDFNLNIKHLNEENAELLIKIANMENDLKTSAIIRPSSYIHLNIIQGNFSDLKLTSSEIKHMKLRVSVQYHQGKEHSKEQSSRTIFSTLNPIWNDLLFFELDSNESLNFTIKLEQMEKHNRKLEKKKELGRYNVSFNHPDLIPTVEQTFNIFDSQQAGKRIGTLQILFDFIQNQMINKEKVIRNMKVQIEDNQNTIKSNEMDLKYLKKLFGNIPNLNKNINAPAIFNYNYSFFDNFNLLYQPIDKYTPKLGFNLETQKEYLSYWEILLFKYFPLLIFLLCLIICFTRADFLTLFLCVIVMPYGKYEWLKFQFLYAKLMLLLVISTDFFWLVFIFPEWSHDKLGVSQGGHAMNCIVWILSLINFVLKILYEIFLIYIFHKVNHGYGYNLPEVKQRPIK